MECIGSQIHYTGIILGMESANKGERYIVASSPIGWVHCQNDPCYVRIRYAKRFLDALSAILNDVIGRPKFVYEWWKLAKLGGKRV